MFLLDVAHEVLGNDLAVGIARTPYMFEHECREAETEAHRRGLKYFSPLLCWGEGPEGIWRNSRDRCYLCKRFLLRQLQEWRGHLGMDWLMDGTQSDDQPSQRPGFRALRELSVRSPLLESGMTKDDIRRLARSRGLMCWNKPSNSCLLTRLPDNAPVTEEALRRVAQAEEILLASGLSQVRARVCGDMLRVETLPQDFEILAEQAAHLEPQLKELGFVCVTFNN